MNYNRKARGFASVNWKTCLITEPQAFVIGCIVAGNTARMPHNNLDRPRPRSPVDNLLVPVLGTTAAVGHRTHRHTLVKDDIRSGSG